MRICIYFRSQWVGCVDLAPNDQADYNLLLTEKTWTGQESELCKLDDQLAEDKLDGIFCVAGGWAGGNASSKGEARIITPTQMKSIIISVENFTTSHCRFCKKLRFNVAAERVVICPRRQSGVQASERGRSFDTDWSLPSFGGNSRYTCSTSMTILSLYTGADCLSLTDLQA